MNIRGDTLQQRCRKDGRTLVSLPVLYVDGKLTRIQGAWFLETHGKALKSGFEGILIGWDTPDWLVKMSAEGRDPRQEVEP